jgi:L-cysteine/cystine lyase
VALTGSTTDGINAVVGGLDLLPGDEVLTSDQEHPGVLAPLGVAQGRRGIEVRLVPFAEIANEVRPTTRLVVCSHVSWVDGKVVDTAGLAAADAPVLLDGAQGLGAIPLDVAALGCEFYAASGQKWLCGPVGSGYLYVRNDLIDSLEPIMPGYGSVADPLRALDGPPAPGAARFDTGFPASHQTAWALAALDVLEGAGLADLQARAIGLAARFASELAGRGSTVAPRGASTLVSWQAADPEAESLRLLEAGFIVRNLPGTPYVRASVGGWTSDDEIDRLVAATSSS